MKILFFSLAQILLIIFLSSCKKNITSCFELDNTAYLVGDTIYVDASCSKNSKDFLWEPGDGLIMLGNGKSIKESFSIINLPGSLSRSINLTVTNSKSSRTKTESVSVF